MHSQVSIIIPCYNAGERIRETLNSVLGQTYRNWEAIVIDDCSTDHSVEIINSFVKEDPRISLIINDENSGGPSIPRNLGIASAKGDLIAFLDSDDIWMPEKLEHQLQFMKEKNAWISSTSYELIDESGNSLGKAIHAQPVMDFNKYLRNTNIGFSSTVIMRELLKGVEFRKMPVAEDFPFWLDVFRKGYTMFGLTEVLTQYRVQKNSLSSNKLRSAKHIWKTYRTIEKFNLLRSLYYFNSYAFNAIKKRL